jgi:hypothetical protein
MSKKKKCPATDEAIENEVGPDMPAEENETPS